MCPWGINSGGGADDFLAARRSCAAANSNIVWFGECCFCAGALLEKGNDREVLYREALNCDLADGRCAARMNEAGRCSSVGRATDS